MSSAIWWVCFPPLSLNVFFRWTRVTVNCSMMGRLSLSMMNGELQSLLYHRTGQVIVILMEFIRYDYSTSYPDGEGADKDEEVNKIHC